MTVAVDGAEEVAIVGAGVPTTTDGAEVPTTTDGTEVPTTTDGAEVVRSTDGAVVMISSSIVGAFVGKITDGVVADGVGLFGRSARAMPRTSTSAPGPRRTTLRPRTARRGRTR